MAKLRLREKTERRVAIQIVEFNYSNGRAVRKPHKYFTVYGTTGAQAETIIRRAFQQAGGG